MALHANPRRLHSLALRRLWWQHIVAVGCIAMWTVSFSAVAQTQQGARFSSLTIQRGIESYLRELIGKDDQITFLTPIEELRFDNPQVIAQCEVPLDKPLAGRVNVEVTFHTNGIELKRIRIPVKITAWRAVPVAKRFLQRGTVLTTEDVSYERRDVTQYIDLLPDSVIGCQLRQSVMQGAPLLRPYLSSNGRIRAGQAVTLVLRSNGIIIRAMAHALQNAEVGSGVKVRRTDTGAVLVGTATDEKTVLVELSPNRFQPSLHTP
ncbi:MAG: flagellar basal body P-ring formation chaperone FlgA [Bacteroidota bacterium]|nr:flagellar basal body P-ring formation chaperone FlgA [Bacteroidota bacterium]